MITDLNMNRKLQVALVQMDSEVQKLKKENQVLKNKTIKQEIEILQKTAHLEDIKKLWTILDDPKISFSL